MTTAERGHRQTGGGRYVGAHQTTLKEMEDNRQRLGIFRITLFGRTMAGKPTPMELLTEGNGDMTS